MSASPLPTAQMMERPEFFRLLVQQVKDYAIFALDERGIVASWNTGAERIKGYAAHEIIGHHFSRFYPEEAIRSGWPQRELDAAISEGSFEDEGWRVRKDGSKFWANVVITALFDEDRRLRGFAKVTRDLTDRRRLERVEQNARETSEFVAMLAHELRNPLSPIKNAVTLAHAAPDGDPRIRWSLGVIDRQIGHLARLVDDLLDVSRITQGKVRLERRRIGLREVLDRALEATRPEFIARDHVLTVHADADATVRGDLVRLTQVLVNLLNNACKFTPQGGRIDVRLAVADGSASITITDNGVGIHPDLIGRIFDVFTQDKRALDRSQGGLGLGLAIAQRLVRMHGGLLTVRSAGPGCGSEFNLTLPTLASDAGLGPGGGLTVLVVEDNQDSAQTLAALIEAHGHQAFVANDGESGLEMAKRLLPDVVLLDIGLPRLNGYQVARAIRSDDALGGVVLVAVTGYASADDRREALETGFDLHLSKPLEFAELLRAVPMLSIAGSPR
jgi:PAS domain S-box-containing protein